MNKNKKIIKMSNTETYEKIADNIYHTGKSYRVRKTVAGSRISKNFPSLRKAKMFLKSL